MAVRALIEYSSNTCHCDVFQYKVFLEKEKIVHKLNIHTFYRINEKRWAHNEMINNNSNNNNFQVKPNKGECTELNTYFIEILYHFV